MSRLELLKWLCLWLTPIETDNQLLITYFNKAKSNIIDWQQFIKLASQTLMTPALYPIAINKQLLVYIPTDVHHYLKDIHALNVQRNQALMQQTLSIIDLLNSNNIPVLALKGIASLLTELYPDKGMRVLGDIDLLIAKENLTKAIELLIANDYKAAQENVLDSYISHHHAVPLIKTGEYGAVELHSHLMPAHAKPLFNIADCWQTAIYLKKHNCYILSTNNRLLHNFYHSQIKDHNYLYAKLSPRQGLEFIYLNQSYQKEINFSECVATLKQYHLLTAFNAYQYCLKYYFNQPILTDLKLNDLARWQYRRTVMRYQCRYFAKLDNIAVLFFIAWRYFMQFSVRNMRLRYPHLSLWKARHYWLMELKKRLILFLK